MDREEWEEHHRTLGLEPGATKDELKTAYRQLARQHHPDAVDGPETAKRRGSKAFQRVQAAYDALRGHAGPPPLPAAREDVVVRGPLAEEPALPPRQLAVFALLACAGLGAAFYMRVRRRPTPPPPIVRTVGLPAARRALPAQPRSPLEERTARMEGMMEVTIPLPRGRLQVWVEQDARKALDYIEAKRGPSGPKLELSVARVALVGVLRPRAGGGGYAETELALDQGGKAAEVDIAAAEDGKGLKLAFKGSDPPFERSVWVTPYDTFSSDEQGSGGGGAGPAPDDEDMELTRPADPATEPYLAACRRDLSPQGGELPEARRVLTLPRSEGKRPLRVVFAPGAKRALAAVNARRRADAARDASVAAAVRLFAGGGAASLDLTVSEEREELLGLWKPRGGRAPLFSLYSVPLDGSGVELAVVHATEDPESVLILGYGPGLASPTRIEAGPYCWRSAASAR